MSNLAKSERRKTNGTADQMVYDTFGCLADAIHKDLKRALDGSDSFRDTYLLESFTSKLGTSKVDENERRLAAISLTKDDEVRNRKTNLRLSKHLRLTHNSAKGPVIKASLDASCKKVINGIPFESILHTTRRLIDEVLGDFTNEVWKSGKFTSGASVGFPKKRTFVKDGQETTDHFTSAPDQKFRKRVTCTPESYAHIIALIRATPPWREYLERKFGSNHRLWVKIVKGNVGFTVRKNAETDRFCAKEASGNMMLQTSLGQHIRVNLKRVFGVDLNDCTRNQYWAFVGSLTGGYATLDLKSASNSLTVLLVYLLLSQEWFDAFNMCRSKYGTYDGINSHRWEMFSSMGNGFTFELESLIFWALSESIRRLTGTPGITTVFGDDIITPTPIAHSVIAVLNYCGFHINTEKSFIKGTFRESCGAHFKDGFDVTPLYVRKPITDTCGLIHILNALRYWGRMKGGIVDERLTPLYRKYRRRISSKYWGGNRLSSRTSLATPGRPNMRLKYADAKKIIDGVPALLSSLMYKENQQCKDENLALSSPDRMWLVGSEDPQVVFEIMGKVNVMRPATNRVKYIGGKRCVIQVTELVTLLEIPVGHEPNTEPPLEEIPAFSWEL